MSEMIYELGNLIESKQEDSVLSSHVINDELVIEAIPSKIVNLIAVSYTHLTLPTIYSV